jgi:hypothetical protein
LHAETRGFPKPALVVTKNGSDEAIDASAARRHERHRRARRDAHDEEGLANLRQIQTLIR